MKVELKKHGPLEQNFIYVRWGDAPRRHVGFCGTCSGMPINFLVPHQCSLTDEEKAIVVAYVIDELGSIKVTKAVEKFMPKGESDEQESES